jgi:hypothetical protein
VGDRRLAGWAAGWSSSLAGRLASWLAGWQAGWLAEKNGSGNWIQKLDYGFERSNFSKWTIQFPIQFSDPIFMRVSCERYA